MKWSTLRKLVWNPGERWDYDVFFVPTAVFVGVWLFRTEHLEHHVILGIAAAASILAVREVLYHYLVRRKRGSGKDAA
jgi:hypothetical protein